MRMLAIALSALSLLAASNAWAAPVSIPAVTLSEALQEKLHEDYGEREGPILQDYAREAVANALTRAGADISDSAAARVDITIEDARVSKPTFEQMSRKPGLDYGASVSLGGAELSAVIRNAGGEAIAEVRHEYRAYDLFNGPYALWTWSDAHRAMRQFASKVARAYSANLASLEQ